MNSRESKINTQYHILLVIFSLIMMFPVIWWVGATFKEVGELSSPNIWPKNPTVFNYIDGWHFSESFTFAKFFTNSLTIELFNVVGSVMTSSLVAFGFARIRFKLSGFWFSLLMMTLMLPSQVTVVPQYIMYNNLGVLDSYVPLILPHFFGGGAFFVFLVVQFIRGIPRELDEAATIDGASTFGIYWNIMMPLIRPALVTVAMYTFMWSWDNFYSQVLYISSMEKYTVGLALRMFIDQFEIKWGQLLAMSLLSVLPSAIMFFSGQKYFVEGIAATGIKG